MENNQNDVEKAQKYAYYYQRENSYYNQNTPNKKASASDTGGLIVIPFVIAIFTIYKYFLTIVLVPAIPSMFLGYKISLLLSNPDVITKLLFIVFFGFLGVVTQLALVRLLIDFIFKKEYVKWLLYLFLYSINIYLIFILADNYHTKDLINVKKYLLEIYNFILNLI